MTAEPPTPHIPDAPTQELLRLYAQILTELLRRGVVRSRNAPAGDLAELLVARAYSGDLAPLSEKSWDVDAGGRKLQVKSRVIDPGQQAHANVLALPKLGLQCMCVRAAEPDDVRGHPCPGD